MIAAHSNHVPRALRAERLCFASTVQIDVRPRRTALRAVFCPTCRSHRTIVADLATWLPSGGVRHVECVRCAGWAP